MVDRPRSWKVKLGASLLGLSGLTTWVASELYAAPPRQSCGCIDGNCPPNTYHFGYYATQWRKWPEPDKAESERRRGPAGATPVVDPPGVKTEDQDLPPRPTSPIAPKTTTPDVKPEPPLDTKSQDTKPSPPKPTPPKTDIKDLDLDAAPPSKIKPAPGDTKTTKPKPEGPFKDEPDDLKPMPPKPETKTPPKPLDDDVKDLLDTPTKPAPPIVPDGGKLPPIDELPKAKEVPPATKPADPLDDLLNPPAKKEGNGASQPPRVREPKNLPIGLDAPANLTEPASIESVQDAQRTDALPEAPALLPTVVSPRVAREATRDPADAANPLRRGWASRPKANTPNQPASVEAPANATSTPRRNPLR